MTIDLKGVICQELDKDMKRFFAGLEARTVYLQNLKVFEEKVPGTDLSMIKYGLFKIQDYHAEMGRYEDPTQQPMFFAKGELAKPKIAWANTSSDVIPIKVDTDQAILDFYIEIIKRICKPGEQKDQYGETTNTDVINILTLYERINGLGRFVAEAKIQEDPNRLIMYGDKLRNNLVRKGREDEVYASVREVFKTHNLGNDETADWFTKTMINKTLDVEVSYIDLTRSYPRELISAPQSRPEYTRTGIGFGQEGKSGNSDLCWGNR